MWITIVHNTLHSNAPNMCGFIMFTVIGSQRSERNSKITLQSCVHSVGVSHIWWKIEKETILKKTSRRLPLDIYFTFAIFHSGLNNGSGGYTRAASKRQTQNTISEFLPTSEYVTLSLRSLSLSLAPLQTSTSTSTFKHIWCSVHQVSYPHHMHARRPARPLPFMCILFYLCPRSVAIALH